MIKRLIFEDLKKHLQQKEMTLIAGPRQAGKSTLLLLLKKYLEDQREKTVLLNLDVEDDREFFVSQQALVAKIRREVGDQRAFVFFDEVQRKEDAGLFFKGIYDMGLPYKFIMTGSGSLELKEQIHESLAGRKLIFELSTLSFVEFALFKTAYRYEQNLGGFLQAEPKRARQLFEEYVSYGGYPRGALADTVAGKQRINEI